MYIVVLFTGFFAMRVMEVVKLKAQQFHLDSSPPFLRVKKKKGAGKSPGDVPILPRNKAGLKELMRNGVSVKRWRKNRFRSWKQEDAFSFPEKGLLFPSRRADHAGKPKT